MGSEYRDDEEAAVRDIPYLTDDETDVEPQDRTLHIRSASESSDSQTRPTLPLPVWMRESAKSFRFRWVPLPLRKAGRATAAWIKGPVPPRELKIIPLFPHIQEAPIRFLDRYFPKKRHRIFFLLVFYASWFLTWSLILRAHSTSGFITGYGRSTNIWCGANFWSDGNGCGLNGNDCRPFSSSHLVFRCPANCQSTHLLEDHFVGNQTLRYQGLVVGGPDPEDPSSIPIYRADSFICQAAIHAGVTTNAEGGCGIATLVGSHRDFPASSAHGIQSTSFPATFPRSFTFQSLSESRLQCPTDSRWGLFAVTAAWLVVLSLFTTSPTVFFYSTFIILIFHVGLVSDPPNTSNFYELLSLLFSRLLPAIFISVILCRYCAVPLLSGLTAQIEKTVLYLGFCFFGSLNNYTFEVLVPIQRLTPEDLGQRGAPTALAIIVTSIVAIVIGQIHFIRVSGNMPKYLKIYIGMAIVLLILLLLPGLRLRIHHYILALVFMPGTAFKTRPSLIYQGLLLGLFINGIARWGFASIIQTPAALSGSGESGDGSWWGATSPNVTAVVAPNASNITFRWGELSRDDGIDGVSILINDVERWRGYIDEELYWNQEEVTLKRRKREEQEPEFFRFAWMRGSSAGTYSKSGVWDEDGIWHPIPEQ
jgi:LCCL domain